MIEQVVKLQQKVEKIVEEKKGDDVQGIISLKQQTYSVNNILEEIIELPREPQLTKGNKTNMIQQLKELRTKVQAAKEPLKNKAEKIKKLLEFITCQNEEPPQLSKSKKQKIITKVDELTAQLEAIEHQNPKNLPTLFKVNKV